MGPIQSSSARNTLNPGPKRRADILFTIAVLTAIYLAWRLRAVLLIIYVSALFAVVISPALRFVQRFRVRSWNPGKGLAFIVILLALVTAFVLFFTLALPPVFENIKELSHDWPNRMAELAEKVRKLPFMAKFRPPNIEGYGTTIASNTYGVFKNLAGGIFGLFTSIILTAYFIFEGQSVFQWGMSLVSHEHRDRLANTFIRAEKRMRHWLAGQFALMLTLGCLSAIAFGLLHLRYFYALAVFAGMANIVPFVGPVTSATVACIVAGMDSWQKMLGVIVFYLIYQQLENAFFTPRIMKTTVDLPPLAVIIALLLGGSLAGILGALVAVPTAALIAEFIDEYLVKRPQPTRHALAHEHESVREW